MHQGTQGRAGCTCVSVCAHKHMQKQGERRDNTNLTLKIKAKSFCEGISALSSAVGQKWAFPQTHPTILCSFFPSAEGQGSSIPAPALLHWALTRISLSQTYDALMMPPRADKELKSWLYPLDTWHAKPCSKWHVLAWEKAIPTLDSHRAQLLMQCLHLPYCY